MPCEVCNSPQVSSGKCPVCTEHYAKWENISGTSVAQFFERDVFVGECTQYSAGVEYTGKRYSGYWPNVAYFCPCCGELWGREILTHKFKYCPVPQEEWKVTERACADCGDGQFLTDRPLEQASFELLLREFQVLLLRY